jgi:hypothetical protein
MMQAATREQENHIKTKNNSSVHDGKKLKFEKIQKKWKKI